MMGVYPGIDMRMHGVSEGLKYDWIVHPGAKPKTLNSTTVIPKGWKSSMEIYTFIPLWKQ